MDIGVIGLGSMGKNHVRVYSKIQQVDEIYVFDVDSSHYNQLRDYCITPCSSVKELLNKVDAVSICVPTNHHYSIAKQVFDANVHCLIEKPATLTITEGNQLLELKPDGLIVGVGHIERFNPIINEIKQVTRNILYCDIKRHNPGSNRITDSTVIKDLMIHDLDIVFNVLFPDKTYDHICYGSKDVCSSLFHFDGSVVSVSGSRISSKKIRSIYIEEEEYTVEGDFMMQEVYIYRKPEHYAIKDERYVQDNIIEKVLVNKVEPLYVELKTFIDCVQKQKPFPVTLSQAVENIRICETLEEGIGWDIISMKAQ
jgi:predicted dehydrogenase